MAVFLSEYGFVHMSVVHTEAKRKSTSFSGAEITGSCVFSDTDAGN